MTKRHVEPKLVATAAAFDDFLDDIEGVDRLAIDTEANSMHAYRARLCLIQCSDATRDWILDPLAGFDLDPFFAILEDPDIEKIFHDAEFDILLLSREHDVRLRGLFDTKVAASALGEEQFGLASLVHRRFGAKLDKTQQRSDWGKRPLDESQVRYAAEDTHYLLELASQLVEELDDADAIRWELARAEFRRLKRLRSKEEPKNPDAWLRIKGSNLLAPKELVVLRELWRWRESVAEKRDLPPFKVLGNAQLLAITRARPTDLEGLARIDGVAGRPLERYGAIWVRILESLRDHPGLNRPVEPERSSAERREGREDGEVFERLKRWRKRVADTTRIDASLVLHREVLERVSKLRPRPSTRAELEATGDFEEWRLDAFAEGLLAAIAGQGSGAGDRGSSDRGRRKPANSRAKKNAKTTGRGRAASKPSKRRRSE
ncbi:MAG: ribonuclease D [Planctomycetes bacterium]|nr:ribonuclease D [Planctomycetota bacterium]